MMVYRRISLPRVISIILFLTFALIFWKLCNHGSVARFQNTCNMTEEYQRNLEELLHRLVSLLSLFLPLVHLTRTQVMIISFYSSVSSQLEHHNFNVFLCYGSLWGEIRQSRLLPWSHKAELCILEDQLIEYGFDDFVKDFQRNQLNIRYIAADGFFYIEASSIGWSQMTSKPFIEIYIFGKDRQVSHNPLEFRL